MDDSMTMTIEFLRARLLSERSVSRTARQRADELAKRVLELEEQLKIVSHQKMKAEKATSDVLAILENHDISDVSGSLNSSSDQEVVPCESKVSNPSKKEEESYANSEIKRNDAEDFSGSELESSPSSGRSLAWKSSKNSLRSHGEKNTNSSMRRHNGFASTDLSSPKQRLGRSCRQIRHRETRSAVEEPKVESVMPDPQDFGASNSSEDSHDCSNNSPETMKEGFKNQGKNILLEGLVSGSSEEESKQFTADGNNDGHGGDQDMERALEHQAQLIGRFEAEEKAQREWEEKFRENKSSTPDSCEPGNYSDVTEERDECKVQALCTSGMVICTDEESNGTVICTDQESNLKLEGDLTNGLSKTHPNGFHPPLHVDEAFVQDRKGSQTLGNDSPVSDFAFPTSKTQNKEHFENGSSPSPSNSSHHYFSPSGFLDKQFSNTAPSSPLDGGSSHSSKAEASGSEKELALMSIGKSNGVGGVLEALQQAKLSLKQKLNGLLLVEAGPSGLAGKAIEPSSPSMIEPPEKAEIPIGCAQLFRVPNDFQFEATKAKFIGSSPQLGLINNYPYMRNALTAGDQYTTGQYVETRLRASTDGNLFTTPQTNGWSRISNQKPSFDPFLDRGGVDRFVPGPYMDPNLGVLTSSQFLTGPFVESRLGLSTQKSSLGSYFDASLPSFTRYPYPVYPEQMPQMMPSNEGVSRPLSSRAIKQQPTSDRFSFYDHHIRPNMYR